MTTTRHTWNVAAVVMESAIRAFLQARRDHLQQLLLRDGLQEPDVDAIIALQAAHDAHVRLLHDT